MDLDVKLYLLNANGEKFMGIGVLWLLENIGVEQSLRKACRKMNLSYSKAYNMLKALEDEVGRAFVERKKGGAQREGLVLTPFAREYMALYKDFQGKAKEAALREFENYKIKLTELSGEDSYDRT